jgi:hypothetical protein
MRPPAALIASDADRLLRQACGRRPQAKAKAKADQPTIFDAEHSRDLSRPTAVEESNYRRPRLLCGRRERPRRRAAEQRDELAPSHHSSGAREFLDLSYRVHAIGFFPLLIHFARAGKRGAAIHAPR